MRAQSVHAEHVRILRPKKGKPRHGGHRGEVWEFASASFLYSQRLGAPYNPHMQSNSSDEWSRLAKYEYGVWAFLILAGILALSLIIYLGYMLV
jgi:hypothetical protein